MPHSVFELTFKKKKKMSSTIQRDFQYVTTVSRVRMRQSLKEGFLNNRELFVLPLANSSFSIAF